MVNLFATVVGLSLSILSASAISILPLPLYGLCNRMSPLKAAQSLAGWLTPTCVRLLVRLYLPKDRTLSFARRREPGPIRTDSLRLRILGLYVLHTAKAPDGYPPSEFILYDEGENRNPQVQVAAHQTTQNVIIQRGLWRDASWMPQPGSPLKDAQITCGGLTNQNAS
jgi:hypothetical protein